LIESIGRISPSVVGAGQAPGAASIAAAGNDFSTMLTQVTADAIDTMKRGEAAAIAGIEGKMPAQQVVAAVMEAERTLQAAIAIRDKTIGALLEISRMQI